MPRVHVNGLNINYQLKGPEEAACVVFLHGFSLGHKMWDPQVNEFAGKYKILRYDLRGQGESESPQDPEEYKQSESIADLLGLLDQLEVEKAFLVGLSNGGNVATHFALNHSERVAGVVICDTGAGSDDPEAWKRQTDAWADLIEVSGPAAFADQYLNSDILNLQPYFQREPGAFDRYKAIIAASNPLGLIHTLRSTVGSRVSLYSLEERLRQMTLPAMVIVGDRDHLCTNPSQFLARTIPNARLEVLPDCGHMTNLERTEVFNGLLGTFLEQYGGPVGP